ncbi:GGDEF domain-containing protein [Paenibacillus cymbidii]|uniref:GGDEF domain-containing protein n=1 Tax=Paenibacillus cymbidii TaxID=1639034 RepID=UPI0010803296|nr:bifunctional diguanylate cyclase/phosphodiesterase [Paenibacillus cymbidii]
MKKGQQAILERGREHMSTPALDQFYDILSKESIRAVYQPIVSLTGGDIFGYEALTRGPEGSDYRNPELLFTTAEQEGVLYRLDSLAREKAIRGSILEHDRQKLFINISSHILYDPRFVPGKTMEILQQNGMRPEHIVFEITERSSIEDFTLAKKILAHYRSQGYKIAIDDAGAGYSSLQAIAELKPDYIKIDRSLISGIHLDKVKECILESFVAFANKMNILLVAEGIEQPEELVKVVRMGVHYAQGYLLGMPSAEAASISQTIIANIMQQKRNLGPLGGHVTIGDAASPIRTFAPNEPISEVAGYFHSHPMETGIVVASDQVPVGLINRERLFQQLAGQYGYSLFWKKTLDHVMDAGPLVVDEMLPVEQVSRMAMARDNHRLYDLVVITKLGRLAGVASIQSILECITKARVEHARVSNPLTGLPGNSEIDRELSERIAGDGKFSVIYADLDYFKWFNDRYGFRKGDRLIQFTAEVIQQSIALHGTPRDFVGHIGGDDFIAISNTERPERLCEDIVRRFDEGVGTFYDEQRASYMEDRHGNRVEGGSVTISLSLVLCETGHNQTSLEHISQTAATLKKQAKSKRGSVYVCACNDEANSLSS